MAIEHGITTASDISPVDPAGRGIHPIKGFVDVVDEAARNAITQTSADRGRVVEQTAGDRPGLYVADGASDWMYLGAFGKSMVGVFNVLDYGAVPDGDGAGGGTDNSTAFQACADAINTAGGGILYIPKGVYRKDTSTDIYSHTVVMGEYAGFDTSYNLSGAVIDATNMAYPGPGTPLGCFHCSGTYSYRFENLNIQGPTTLESNTSYYHVWGLAAIAAVNIGTYYVNIVNVHVHDFHHGFYLREVSHFSVRHCSTHTTKHSGLTIYGANQWSAYGFIENCNFSNSAVDNVVVWCDSASGVKYVELYLPITDECERNAVRFYNAFDCTLRGNILYTGVESSEGTGVRIDTGCKRVTVDGLHVTEYDGDPVEVATIFIHADARKTLLSNVRTNSCSGNDLVDNAPDTSYSNCEFDGLNMNSVATNEYGGTIIRYTRTVTATLSGATTDIDIDIPSGARIISCATNNDVAVTGCASFDLDYITGSTQSIAAAVALAQNTKVTKPFDTNAATDITSAITKIRATANGGTFSGGTIRVVATYEVYVAVKDA